MKEWKRCLAAVLSFITFVTSTSINNAAGVYDKEYSVWSAKASEIIGEYYGLEDEALDVLNNSAINTGSRYRVFGPYENTNGSKRNLLAVDYINKVVYAKTYTNSGYTWLPTKAVLSADGEVVEIINLATGITYYNDIEYNASQAFTYDGNQYTVELIFELSVNINEAEQLRLLQIPKVLGQTANNIANQLYGLYHNAQILGEMSVALNELLNVSFEKTEVVTRTVNIDEEAQNLEECENSEEVDETLAVSQENIEGLEVENSLPATKSVKETVITQEPALNPEKHAEEITAIKALYNEYTSNNGLVLYHLSEKYRSSDTNLLDFALAYGNQIQQSSEELYEIIDILSSSKRLYQVIGKLQETDIELYSKIHNLRTVLNNLNGRGEKTGPVVILKDSDNWQFLNDSVRASILKSSYTKEAYAALESAVYALKNTKVEIPTVQTEMIRAAEVGISCNISICKVTVTVSGDVMSGEVGSHERIAMEPNSKTLILLEGSSEAQVRTAIEESCIEENTVGKWNALNSDYQINTANYDRVETEFSGTLREDIPDYKIVYSPKEYKVSTNFCGNEILPYGFQMEFPASTDDEISYDYVVQTEDGTKVSYNEGVTYKVTKSVEITQTEGAEKSEYRLYDFLVNDIQYSMDDEAKYILGNAAIDSPTLNIRIPDGSTVSDVIFENGVYRITASDYSSGILGMSWEANKAYVMNGDVVVEEVAFIDGVATWNNADFTHVRVDYRLKIEKVKNGILNRDLDEVKDVLYALNLPYELTKDVAKQNQLLGGDEGTTVKTLYQNMESISMFMSQKMLTVIGNSMKRDGGRDAVRRLQTSESQIVRDTSGKKMGYGAWSNTADELALYTYMGLCADANWSLAVYYQEALYVELAKQMEIVADCLEAIVKDKGIDELLADYGMESKKSRIEELVPQLRYLAAELSPPHKALDINSSDFSSLIEMIISMEGEASPVDISSGIYAYSSVRKNGEKSGSIQISVKVGSKLSKVKEVNYILEDGVHVLTEEEAAQVETYITELETAAKLTEEEKQYYDLVMTAIPKAGDTVGKNEIVSLVYSPKEYTVSFDRINDYTATFKYNSDHVIKLPAYSEKVDEVQYYSYMINGAEKRVNNGSCGYYTFTKEELSELFENQHYQVKVLIKKSFSPWDVKPIVVENDGLIRKSYLDFKNKLLFLDVAPTGITINEFDSNVSFENGLGEKIGYTLINSNRNANNYMYLANGSYAECYSQNEDGEEVVTEYTIILMGDVNKDGLMNKADMNVLVMNYLGIAKGDDRIIDTASKLAADMNGNGKSYDSNDALLMSKKQNYWNPVDEVVYKSVLE